jgi:hypothetical protein
VRPAPCNLRRRGCKPHTTHRVCVRRGKPHTGCRTMQDPKLIASRRNLSVNCQFSGQNVLHRPHSTLFPSILSEASLRPPGTPDQACAQADLARTGSASRGRGGRANILNEYWTGPFCPGASHSALSLMVGKRLLETMPPCRPCSHEHSDERIRMGRTDKVWAASASKDRTETIQGEGR